MSHKVWRSSNRCYETSHQPQNLSQFVWTTVSGCLVQVTEQWAHCVCQRNDRRCRVIRGNYPVARGAVVDVNEAGKVCLLANGRTTEMHVGLDTPTHWCILPSTNSLIDIYFVNTKDLTKGLAHRTFKSESKSKSSKNGLKSGLEYCKSVHDFHFLNFTENSRSKTVELMRCGMLQPITAIFTSCYPATSGAPRDI